MLTPAGHINCPAEFSSFKCQNPYILTKAAGEFDTFKGFKAFPCGKCIFCRSRKRKQWTTRLTLETESHEENAFITLTYKEYDPFIESELFAKSRSLDYTDIQKFHKHLKMNIKRQGEETYKHFNAGEYGEIGTKRAHWHLILFGFKNTPQNEENILKIWKHSNLTERVIEPILDTESVAKYVSKYVIKKIGMSKEEYEKIHKQTAPMHHGSTGLGWARAKEILTIPALESWKEFGDFNHLVYNGKKVFLDRYLAHKLALHLGEILECGHGIKNAITHKSLEQLKAYIDETKKIYKIYAPTEFEDETLPEYKYFWDESTELGRKTNKNIQALRRAWWYRHKARHFKAEKFLKLQEFKNILKKNIV